MGHSVHSGDWLPHGTTKITPLKPVFSVLPRTSPVFSVATQGSGYCMLSLDQVIPGIVGLCPHLPTNGRVLSPLLWSLPPYLSETRAWHRKIVPLF